jgi:hypothetical protein
MDYDEIIENIKKYHFLACGENKCKMINCTDTKKEAKENLLEILEEKWDKLIGTIVYLVIIKKSTDNWDPVEDDLLPGPIFMSISEYKIKKNNTLKFYGSGINSNVYSSKKYLEKNKKIKKKDIQDLVLKYKNRELKKGLMSKNVI